VVCCQPTDGGTTVRASHQLCWCHSVQVADTSRATFLNFCAWLLGPLHLPGGNQTLSCSRLLGLGLVVLTFLPYNVVRCEWSSGYALLHPCSSRNVERRRAWPPLGSHAFLLNTPQRTPLYVAAEEGRTSFVIELLRRGAEVNAPSVPLPSTAHITRRDYTANTSPRRGYDHSRTVVNSENPLIYL
jgi:hypothetical protein